MNINSLDFTKIRTYKGSQNNAFEELICQLARLSRPENAKCFIRKEGSGGDAGVECFWKLKDDSEYAWQAKYFFKLEKSQWAQISKSVETALKKHPKLKKYYICLPLDRTDPRKDNQNSQLDNWNKKIKKWKEIADSKNMNVEFVFWGASEIFNMLSKDDPHFSGRSLYWFNSSILQIQHLKSIAEKSKNSLGDRFSPELNIELPIAKSFDGIGLTPNWNKRFLSIANKWFEQLQNLQLTTERINQNNTSSIEKKSKKPAEEINDIWGNIKPNVNKLSNLLKRIIKENTFFEKYDELKKTVEDIFTAPEHIYNDQISRNAQKIQNALNIFMNAHSKLSNFLCSKDMMAFVKKTILLSGDAGAGKSHLLCDITLNRLNNNLPALFLLGQHYEGGDPLKFISNALDLNNNSHKEILGALNALGEACSTRTLIIIDAINEGPHKEDWKNHIINLVTELKEYLHIALVFSCRSTYREYLLPDEVKNSDKEQTEEKLTIEIKHTGFSDPNETYKYLEKQDIFVLNTPIMEPEFFNPLFVKIYCKALKEEGENQFPTGLTGIKKIFDFYINAVSSTINRKKQYREKETIVSKALQSFALHLFPGNLDGLQTKKAREIIQNCDPQPNTGCLFNELLNEGILSEDIISISDEVSAFSSNKKEEPIVRFTYERFSDYFIAESLIQKHIINNPLSSFEKTINKLKLLFYKKN